MMAFGPDPVLRQAKRVLVADTGGFGQKLVCDVLDLEGYDVRCVADGEAAVRAVDVGDYDLVMMDLGTPAMEGREAVRRIRTLAEPKNRVPIVLLSTLSRIESPTLDMHGADEMLLRPVSLAALRDVVCRWTADGASLARRVSPAA